jgi:hypothetical protein
MKTIFCCILSMLALPIIAQKEIPVSAPLQKATVFFTGAQLHHEYTVELKPGKQEIVFQKLTDFIDPNTVQVKAKGALTILSVRTRKNYEDPKISNEEIEKLNSQKKAFELKNEALQNEYNVLDMDRNLLLKNQELKGNDQGLKIAELKEAYAFMHQKLMEINTRQSAIYSELEELQKQINKIEQEILSQRSKPVINYSEIVVEVDVEKTGDAYFFVQYITPNATWKPYYDMRSDGIGKPVKLEAKANVSQTSGIEWKNIDVVLSTNDPYENAQEPDISPWYINYNNTPQKISQKTKQLPSVDYSGQKIRGEVIDASTGLSLPFAKITFPSNPTAGGAVTDFEGKFVIIVPKGETQLKASFVGYDQQQQTINSAYIKFFVKPQAVELLEVRLATKNVAASQLLTVGGVSSSWGDAEYTLSASDISANSVRGARKQKVKTFMDSDDGSRDKDYAPTVTTIVEKKDMRMEYTILSKMSIPSDGMEHKLSIASFDMNANYEYHAIPKVDPSVYLSAQVSGWEKLNLLSGESNIYFDGTFLGKSYLDASTTKDTLSFSFGKEAKMKIERIRIKEKSKQRLINNRQKFEVSWEIKLKNNGGAVIPVVIKDQFPISTNADIKVREGEVGEGKVEENTKIITWVFKNGIPTSQVITFDYSVDYQHGIRLYLE